MSPSEGPVMAAYFKRRPNPLVRLRNPFVSPTVWRVVMWVGVVVLFAIHAMTFSTQYICSELSGDG